MADHINIQDPARFDLHSIPYRDALAREQMRVELEMLQRHYDCLKSNLDSIFNRIERGEDAELHYMDGRVFIITGKLRGDT